jgi:hypothetical protein
MDGRGDLLRELSEAALDWINSLSCGLLSGRSCHGCFGAWLMERHFEGTFVFQF